MADLTLDEALDRCIDRLNAGATVADCLADFPQHAAALESLLESGLALRRAQASAGEATAARERGRLRFEQALQRPPVRRLSSATSRLLGLVASVALISLLFLSGASILAENSLPGDPLYGLKRWTETLRLDLIQDPALADTFAQRRIDEAKQIVDLGRVTSVQFTGKVESVGINTLVIEGLRVIIPDARQDIVPGSRLMLRANSSSDGSLFATEIRYLETPEPTTLPAPSGTPRPTLTFTPEPSATPTATDRPTQRPSDTAEASATRRPSATASPTRRPTATASSSPVVDSAQNCADPAPPEGWLRYTVQAGDTASELAASTGLTLDELADANCLDDAGRLIVGQAIYLPQRPPTHVPTLRPSATPEMRPTATTESRDQGGQRDSTPSRRGGNDDGGGSDDSGGNSGEGGGDDSGGRGRG